MRRYAAFGFNIESAMELPELEPATLGSSLDWRIRVAHEERTVAAGAAVGSDLVYGDVHVRVYASETTLRIAFDDTGVFDIWPSRREIVWHPGPRPTDAAVRADVLGRVMALAAHADGHLSLHASAVSVAGRAVAIVGPKHAGKSTLALALVRQGARLITDDTLVVRLEGGRAWAPPGVQRVRLWQDAARALGALIPEHNGAKPVLALAPNEIETAPLPLAACYVLSTSPESNCVPVRRERLSPVHAALACVRFTKLGALGGGSVGAAVLDRAGTMTSAVPAFLATVRRDLTKLDEVAQQLMAWHDPVHVADPAAVR